MLLKTETVNNYSGVEARPTISRYSLPTTNDVLNLEERDLAIRIFDAIMLQFEPSQPTDCGYYPVTLIRLIREDLLDEYDERIGPGQDLSHLAPFPHLPSEQKDALRESLLNLRSTWWTISSYPVTSSLFVGPARLPSLVKALAGKTPQPTAALSRSTTADVAIGTPQRVSNLHKSCLIRDRYRCVITGKFDAQEAQTRYKRDRRDVKNDDGKPQLPERDTMAYLETESKQIADRVLTMFNPGAIHLIDGVDIDRPMNALTLTVDLHRLFGNFEIPFEPVGTQPHTYKVDYVESGRMGRVEKLPITVGLFLTPDRSVDPPSP
ncbi:hypothetical protein AAWM_11168 [Aspergillus awamori]|uniref:HNH nuclease domain-containing protein n=1 Tax=Aspergillus awamori TaxID=105351 RepID=A0A401L9Q4_ASPAW|nr:hypothetical protein AAWM_11168 [Aspergillus awamori]